MRNVAEKCFSANVPKVVLGVGTTMLVINYLEKCEIGVVPDATRTTNLTLFGMGGGKNYPP